MIKKNTVQHKARFSVTVSRAHSVQGSFVLSEIRAGKLGGFKRVLRELHKLIYECTSEGSGCLQKRFDGILFSSLLHVIPKDMFLIAILLCPRSSRETAVTQLLQIKCHLVSESGFTETHCLCTVSVWTKKD